MSHGDPRSTRACQFDWPGILNASKTMPLVQGVGTEAAEHIDGRMCGVVCSRCCGPACTDAGRAVLCGTRRGTTSCRASPLARSGATSAPRTARCTAMVRSP